MFNVKDTGVVITDTSTTAANANTVLYSGNVGYDLADGIVVKELSATTGNGTARDVNGTDNIFLVGNNQVQSIYGNAGNNILNGQGGVDGNGLGDQLIGGKGDDTYRVFTSNIAVTGGVVGISTAVGDQITEATGEGSDVVYTSTNYALAANVEQLVAASQADMTSLTLVGNATNNTISGSNGNNVLVGGFAGGASDGNDVLTGLGGADTFHFTHFGTASADTIVDFNSAEGDKISLDAGVFTGFGPSVDGLEFQNGTIATGGAQPTILYDQSTGRLFYDSDGTGGTPAELFATVTPGTALTASDFVITTAGTLPTP